jgi:NAD(P)-dependent dehydrogenase (short-subunit alcohol dehydrogenase family)
VPFEQITDADWRRFFDVNVLGGVRLSRLYLPGMKQRNWGRIIFISSESGVQIPPEMIHYGMTKAAEIAIARGLAESLAGTGVTVNSILPGPPALVAWWISSAGSREKTDLRRIRSRIYRGDATDLAHQALRHAGRVARWSPILQAPSHPPRPVPHFESTAA